MLPHNPGCWLVNINKFITSNIFLILGLVLKYHIFVANYRKHSSPSSLSYGITVSGKPTPPFQLPNKINPPPVPKSLLMLMHTALSINPTSLLHNETKINQLLLSQTVTKQGRLSHD